MTRKMVAGPELDSNLVMTGNGVDNLSAKRRSANMRQIRSKDTVPEIELRRLVHHLGCRFRLHRKDLPGKPDLVLPARRKVIFLHGCFWHHHRACADGRIPKSRVEYWEPKLIQNVKRDRQNCERLRALGWKSLVVWECELTDRPKLVERLRRFLMC